MNDPYITAAFFKYDDAPKWWQDFVNKNKELVENMPSKTFGSSMNEFLKDKNARIVSMYNMNIDIRDCMWLIYFEAEEDFIAFKLKWC